MIRYFKIILLTILPSVRVRENDVIRVNYKGSNETVKNPKRGKLMKLDLSWKFIVIIEIIGVMVMGGVYFWGKSPGAL
jgi:hypothetical protein